MTSPSSLLLTPGAPEPLGVTLADDGVNVAVWSEHAAAIEICLFDRDEDGSMRETARLRLPERTGDVFHGHVAGVKAGQLYGLRAYGAFDPSRGQRFNPAKLLIDPYATRLDSAIRLHPSQFSHTLGQPDADLTCDEVDSAAHVPKAVVEDPGDISETPRAGRERPGWAEKVVYELHVKGFTQLHPDVPEAIRGTFAGLGHPAVVGHLKALGVTTVELMPAMAWVEERHLPPLGLTNAWGYNPVALVAPDPRLAPGGWAEVRQAVSALQDAGMEVILDVVLNHTGEGDELGPTLSMRGLDNALYYRLRLGDGRRYIDDAGCGNVLALDRPPVLRLAMDALRTWVVRGGLDGFRFDLATTLGRRADGFDPAAPLLSAIAQDPVLRDITLIAEPWDIGPGGYQTGRFPAAWAEWNDRYRDDVRRFWRGDGFMLGALATRLAGSQDLFSAKRRPSRSLNYIIAHDGFTLADLVSYDGKHNEANGEHNRDGTDANQSWNHGVEGPTDDPGIAAARLRDQRALLATLFVSRGTPMLAMGMEGARTQDGNNNAYAQDNRLNWLDWAGLEAELSSFTARLAALRREHPALRADRFLTGEPGPDGLDDVVWLNQAGRPMTDGDWNWGDGGFLALALSAQGARNGQTDRIVVILHRGWEPTAFTLPWSRPGFAWRLAVDSASGASANSALVEGEGGVPVPARAVLIFAEEKQQGVKSTLPASSALIGRLAEAAGIAPEWWDETGGHHAVSDDTKRALLATMGLSAATAGAAADALALLAETRTFRPIPETVVCRTGERARLTIPCPAADGRIALVVALENGDQRELALDPAQARTVSVEAVDRRRCRARVFTLPDLPEGVHRLWLNHRPEVVSTLLVAPRRCHRPEALMQGRRAFGLGAHLYSLRSAGDQGLGDFTTLGALGTLAASLGAATVGLNPLHALFAGNRERASPYHPSDRRFLDPIYLDLAAVGPTAGVDLSPPVLRDASTSLAPHGRFIDYSDVWRRKSAALEAAFALFLQSEAGPAREAFAEFRSRGGVALERFARFEALSEVEAGPWSAWPAALRHPASDAVTEAAPGERVTYHAWLQWLCDRQFASAATTSREAGLSLGFYRDLAVGAAPDGAETWSSPGVFALGASVGAPPDRFSAEGQVWNLPPPNPLVQQATAGAAFDELLAANMSHAGLLRIDHAMALTRLFWVPDGARGRDGAYVAAPLDVLMARLTLQSARRSVAVVGEDLGTVPDGFRDRLSEADVLSYKVLWFEREGSGFTPPERWPAASAGCVSTHDLPTLAGWWTGNDITEKQQLGLLDAAAAEAARQLRSDEKTELLRELVARGLLVHAPELGQPMDDDVAAAIHALVAAAPSCLMLAQVDDLIGEIDAINLPGTDRERPNWRRRLETPVEAMGGSTRAQAIVRTLAARQKQ